MGKTVSPAITFTVTPASGATSLATFASSLVAGADTATQFVSPTIGSWMGKNYWYYSGSGLWDSTNKKAWFFLKEAASNGNDTFLVSYTDATNTWAVESVMSSTGALGTPYGLGTKFGWPLGRQAGHGYYSFTLDKDNKVAFLPLYLSRMAYFDPNGTSTPDGAPGLGASSSGTWHPQWVPYNITNFASDSGPNAICFHPNLFGPGQSGILAGCDGSRIRGFATSGATPAQWNWVWTFTTDGSDDHNAARYVSAQNAVYISAGEGLSKLYKVTGAAQIGDQPTVQTIVDNNLATWGLRPAAHAGSSDSARMVETPGGSIVLFPSKTANTNWARLNTATNAFELQTGLNPFRVALGTGQDTTIQFTYVSTYGIYLAINCDNNTASHPFKVWGWKPPTGF